MLGNLSSAKNRCCGVATGTSSNAADIPAYLLAELAGALPAQADSTSLASDEQTGHLVSSCQLRCIFFLAALYTLTSPATMIAACNPQHISAEVSACLTLPACLLFAG